MSNRLVIHRHPPPLTVEMMKCASTELPMGLFFVSKADDTQIVGHRADVCLDNIQIMIEVHLTSGGTGTLYADKRSVDPANIGLPINLNICHLFMIFNLSPNAMYAYVKRYLRVSRSAFVYTRLKTKTYCTVSVCCSVRMSLTTKSKTCHCCFSHHISSSTETPPLDEIPEETPNIHYHVNSSRDPFAELLQNVSDT